MSYKLSIFTTGKLPRRRGDLYAEPLSCYLDLADEVVYVEGNTYIQADRESAKERYDFLGIKFVNHAWRKEFKWDFIGQQFTRGYQACTGDAVIHADLDFIFHEKDFESIRDAVQLMLGNNLPGLSFYKYQFVLPDRYIVKSNLVVMVNKRDYGDRIKFDSSGDLCQPSIDGRYINPNVVPEAKIGFYNYDKLLKTQEQIADDQGRMERAWFRQFGYYQMGSDGTDKSAYYRWVKAQIGKFNKPQEKVKLQAHPKYVQETIKNLTPEMWGYNGHGNLEANSYVTSS